MRKRRLILLACLLAVLGAALLACRWQRRVSYAATRVQPHHDVSPEGVVPAPQPGRPATVRVAAIQTYSRVGAMAHNRKLLTDLITEAAARGARIVVLPECALQGYMDPVKGRTWTAHEPASDDTMPVAVAAEPVPGSSTRHFAALAQRLSIYLALPLIEVETEKFYNALVLLDPEGRLVAHHRKHALWPPGDAGWATADKKPIRTVPSPYGRLGLMVCYDVHALPRRLKSAGAEIVLYAVGWVGPNTENWYRDVFPRRYVIPNGFAVVAANWSAEPGQPTWDGAGYSCVIDAQGGVLAMAKTTSGTEIVIADLPLAETIAAPQQVGATDE